MLHPSTKRLIDKLSDMTRKQRVAWTESDDGSVTHDTEGYRVILTPEPHAIFLTDALGRQIETCTPDEFADETDAHGRPYAKFVAELFREAHRHARGTEKAIRTLLQTLDAAEADLEASAPEDSAQGGTSGETEDATEALIDDTAPIEGEQAMTEAVASLAEQINNVPPPPVVDVTDAEAEPAHADLSQNAEPPAQSALEGLTETPAAPDPTPIPPPAPEPAVLDEPKQIQPAPGTAYGGGFFGTYGGVGQYTGPPDLALTDEPAAAAPRPPAEPETAQAPESQPGPLTGQRISLSSIPYGFGLGAVNSSPSEVDVPPVAPVQAHVPEAQTPAEPAPPRRLIDGTVDLPDPVPDTGAGWVVREPTPDIDPAAAYSEVSLDDVRDSNPPDPDSPTPDPGANPVRRFNPWN